MDNALKMGQKSATGSFQLFIGKIISTIILGISSIFVGILISEGDYGLYAIALIPATTILLFQDWGVGSAMTKYCANYRATKQDGKLRKIILAGLTFEAITGLVLTLFAFLIANFVASEIFTKPESAYLITLFSITILFTAIYIASQSIFAGFERMELTAISMVVLAVTQGLLSPLLVYFGFGAFGAVVGYTLGAVVSGITALVLLYFAVFRGLSRESKSNESLLQTLKPLLNYGIPLAAVLIISGFSSQFYAFMMASFVDAAMIGNYRIAINFASFLTFFTFPIHTVLFPAFSKIDPKKDKILLKTVFASSVKYASLLLVPSTIAIMVLSQPMISTIFGDKWLQAPLFLTLGVLGNLFTLIGSLSYGRLIVAQGKTKMMMKLSLLLLCIGIPLAVLLIPPFGILGAILVGYVGGIPGLIIGINWIWKNYGVKAEFGNSAKIFLASAISGLITYLFLNIFIAEAWIMLALGAILFLLMYIVLAPLVGAITQMDLDNFRAMFAGLGIISKLLMIPLMLIEKLLGIYALFSKKIKQKSHKKPKIISS